MFRRSRHMPSAPPSPSKKKTSGPNQKDPTQSASVYVIKDALRLLVVGRPTLIHRDEIADVLLDMLNTAIAIAEAERLEAEFYAKRS